MLAGGGVDPSHAPNRSTCLTLLRIAFPSAAGSQNSAPHTLKMPQNWLFCANPPRLPNRCRFGHTGPAAAWCAATHWSSGLLARVGGGGRKPWWQRGGASAGRPVRPSPGPGGGPWRVRRRSASPTGPGRLCLGRRLRNKASPSPSASVCPVILSLAEPSTAWRGGGAATSLSPSQRLPHFR